MILCPSRVSIIVKNIAYLIADSGQVGTLFLGNLHSNSGILAGAAGNSLLTISLSSIHDVCNRCYKISSVCL